MKKRERERKRKRIGFFLGCKDLVSKFQSERETMIHNVFQCVWFVESVRQAFVLSTWLCWKCVITGVMLSTNDYSDYDAQV